MKKYEVSMSITIDVTVAVEAESEEQAREQAMLKTANEPSFWISRWNSILEREVTEVNEPEDEDPADTVAADDPAQAVYASYSKDMRKAVAYVNQQLEPEDKAIICAKVDKNFKQHMNPAYGIDDGKIIDLLEEYGDDHDLGEGWWMEECDMDDIVLLVQFEN